MATGIHTKKIPWGQIDPFRSFIFPPGIWPDMPKLCDLDHYRKLQLDHIFAAIMDMERPSNGQRGTRFRFPNAIINGKLTKSLYKGMPKDPKGKTNNPAATKNDNTPPKDQSDSKVHIIYTIP